MNLRQYEKLASEVKSHASTIRLIWLVALLALASACSSQEKEAMSTAYSADAGKQQAEPKAASKYVAYRHTVALEVVKEDLVATHAVLKSACEQDTSYDCVVLNSKVSGADYTHADIQMRMLP